MRTGPFFLFGEMDILDAPADGGRHP